MHECGNSRSWTHCLRTCRRTGNCWKLCWDCWYRLTNWWVIQRLWQWRYPLTTIPCIDSKTADLDLFGLRIRELWRSQSQTSGDAAGKIQRVGLQITAIDGDVGVVGVLVFKWRYYVTKWSKVNKQVICLVNKTISYEHNKQTKYLAKHRFTAKLTFRIDQGQL